MTALTASRVVVRTTGFERMLLTAAAHIDRFVDSRLARRATASRAIAMQVAATDARSDARAMGSLGILPR